jgi:SAM-dependent methyltransferase
LTSTQSFALRLTLPLLAVVLAAGARAQDFPRYGDEIYQPRLRQPGKDVMWIPTPDAMIPRMLSMARVNKGDLVYDLGAGEGRITIAAAKEFGATSVGIEYDPKMAELARRNAQRAGVADKVTIIQGDIFKEDFSKATVVALYLLPDLNHQLRPQLLKMKPGTRVVSHAFSMDDWQADQTETAEGRTAYLWIVPAPVSGKWQLPGDGELTLKQSYQMISGVLKQGGKERIVKGRLSGDQITFAADADPRLEFSGRVSGGSMQGTVRDPAGEAKWSATRASN